MSSFSLMTLACKPGTEPPYIQLLSANAVVSLWHRDLHSLCSLHCFLGYQMSTMQAAHFQVRTGGTNMVLAHSAHVLLEAMASGSEHFPVLPPDAPGIPEKPQAAPNRRGSCSRNNTCDVPATLQQHKQMLWATFDVSFFTVQKSLPWKGWRLFINTGAVVRFCPSV